MTLILHAILCILFSMSMSDDAGEAPEIVNGQPADATNYPWIASIRRGISTYSPQKSACTASLIQRVPPVVLTAAHCVEDYSYDADANSWFWHNIAISLNVDIGRTYPSFDDGNNEYTTTLELDSSSAIVIHPGYHIGFYSNNDVALITFAESSQVASIPYVPSLPLQSNSECCDDGEELTILGYGATDNSGRVPDTLQRATLSFLPMDQCMFKQISAISTQVFCATSDTSAMCFGDSGGPVLKGANAQGADVELAGIISFSTGGCGTIYPDASMNVAYYRDWIDSVVSSLSPNGAVDESRNSRLSRMFLEHGYKGRYALIALIQDTPLQTGSIVVLMVALCLAVVSKYGTMWQKGKNFVYERIPESIDESGLNEC